MKATYDRERAVRRVIYALFGSEQNGLLTPRITWGYSAEEIRSALRASQSRRRGSAG